MMARRINVVLLGFVVAGACDAGRTPQEFDLGMQSLRAGNYAEAYCRWKPLAERNHAEAQYNIGWLYANGNGLAVDIDIALDWWMKAAAQGHADAQFAVGLAYTTGEGIKADLNEAVTWYLAAARQGHQDAREILLRLNGDPTLDLLQEHPELARESWFGWTAEINSDRINVRAGPGTEYEIVAQMEKGAAVRVIGQRGDWYMVVLPPVKKGQTAWIFKTLVSDADR
jgi:SH3-like domain-containing protein